jgi:hypothetical protein
MAWVPDPEAPAQGWLHVTDLDGRLWSRGVSRTRFEDWVLLVDVEEKKRRGKL